MLSRQAAKLAKKEPCHFDRREKSLFRAKREIFFLDPSRSLGMTGLAHHLGAFASWRETQFFQSSLHPKISNMFG